MDRTGAESGSEQGVSGDAASLYGLYYFQHGCGRPYKRDEAWLNFFGGIAERIVSELSPATVLDAGCALGFLVEGLRSRGVEAMGLDISEYAIGEAHEDVRPFCQVGSVTDPLPRRYELIVCIEVLEHLQARDAERAIANFCDATDDVLFSSTPIDFKEATHFNVRPPEYWAESFARHGLYRDLDFDASFITPWAALFRRRRQSAPRVVAGYERRLWHLLKEIHGSREVALEQRLQLGDAEAAVQALSARFAELEEAARGRSEAEQRLAELSEAAAVAERTRAEAVRRLAEAEGHAEEYRIMKRERSDQAKTARATMAWAKAAAEEARGLAERLAECEREMAALKGSGAWTVAKVVHRARVAIAPNCSRRHHAARLAVQAARVLRREGLASFARKSGRRLLGRRPLPAAAAPTSQRVATAATAEGDYADWIARHEPDATALEAQRADAAALASRPLISILTPVYDTPPAILDATIRSVVEQSYDHWELCLVDGGSTDSGTRLTLDAWAGRDPRVRVERLEKNLGISGNTNAAIAICRGDFVALLDHDDILAPSALFEVARRLEIDPELDFLYSDKDLISEDGTRRFAPLFKPDWSPEVMLSANYLTHLCVIRTELAREVGGFRAITDGAQDWDFFLRVLERTDRVAHIPRVLYHWRYWSKSVASGIEAKPYALEAQKRSIEEHLLRTGQDGVVHFVPGGYIRIRRRNAPRDKVSIIVSTRGSSGHLPRLLQDLREGTDYEALEVVIIHGGPKTPQLREYYEDIAGDSSIQVLDHDGDPDSPEAKNLAAQHATGELLLFLSESLEPLDDEWLGELVEWASCPGIGMMGAKIVRGDGTIEHAGLVAGLDGLIGPIFAGMPDGHGGIFGSLDWYRNYSAVTGDCLMIRRALFEDLGGFDQAYVRYGGDVDLCLRAVDRGLRVVYTPFARLKRIGASPSLDGAPASDLKRLHARCMPILLAGDRYYNPNLSLNASIPWLNMSTEPTPVPSLLKLPSPRPKAAQDHSPAACRPRHPMSEEAQGLVSWLDFTTRDLEASNLIHTINPGPLTIRSVNWFIPDFHNAFYGGIYTILRYASYLKRQKGVLSRFHVVGGGDEARVRSSIARAFPNLYGDPVRVVPSERELGHLEYADACIATLWVTAYYALKFNRTRRKFYFLQDYEPLFYPAGSTSAQVEATYRFGFNGIANTVSLKEIYEREYGGTAEFFTPCVDTEIFHPHRIRAEEPGKGHRIFFYGRPHNLRNGFELGTAALRRLKQRLGDRVTILAAGDDWRPADYGLEGVVENLGLLGFEETAALYRTCDAGLALMFTRHPSYLPFEFMASGCLVVTNRNPATAWLLKDRENCLLTEASVECIADTLEEGLADRALREQITATALTQVREAHADWNSQFEKIFGFMTDPFGQQGDVVLRSLPRPDDRILATA